MTIARIEHEAFACTALFISSPPGIPDHIYVAGIYVLHFLIVFADSMMDCLLLGVVSAVLLDPKQGLG